MSTSLAISSERVNAASRTLEVPRGIIRSLLAIDRPQRQTILSAAATLAEETTR